MQDARRSRCAFIVDDEQRCRHVVTPCRPPGCGVLGPSAALPLLDDGKAYYCFETQEELAAIRDGADPTALDVEQIDVRPRKSDTTVGQVRLVWTPWKVGPDGIAEPLA